MQTQTQTPRIEKGITKLIIPHKKGELVSTWPSKSPGAYQNVGKEILADSNNLRLQTGYETSLLAKSAYESDEPEFLDVKQKINDKLLWVYHVNFWLPKKDRNSGVYSVYDPNAIGRDMVFNQEELEEILRVSENYQGVRFNSDKGVAFAPRNTIRLGKQKDWDAFKINGLVIATYFPDGAENLAGLGKKNFNFGFIGGVSGNDTVEKRVSSLVRFGGLDVGLDVNGNDCWDADRAGYTFGILK